MRVRGVSGILKREREVGMRMGRGDAVLKDWSKFESVTSISATAVIRVFGLHLNT